MSLAGVIYSPLKEDTEQLVGWDKQTIDYITKNKSSIYNTIRAFGKGNNKLLQRTDIDDIYMEVLEYAYKNDDYNITKAVELSNSDNVVSLTGYIHSFIKYIVIKYISDKYEEESKIIDNEIKDSDNDAVDIFDIIPDKKANANSEEYVIDKLNELDSICSSYESQRYEYGIDIFQIWFIRLTTMHYNKQEHYEDIIESLGINKSDIGNFHRRTNVDDVMLSIAKAITIIGIEEAISVLRKYTYGANKIEKVIYMY